MIKKAVILGVTGLVGHAVAQCFLNRGLAVCGIARSSDCPSLDGQNEKFKYIAADLNDLHVAAVKDEVSRWMDGEECAVLNFVWSGHSKLRDGTLEEQLKNVMLSTDAIKFASDIGCVKFVHAGSQDERIYADYLASCEWKKSSYPADLLNYAAAKFFAKEMNQLSAYLQKIDYIHTRFSAVVSADLETGGYIPQTLGKIRRSECYVPPLNPQLYDIVLLDDLAEMYFAVTLYGENQKNYYLGSGRPGKLADFFCAFEKVIAGNCNKSVVNGSADAVPEMFCNDLIKELCAKSKSSAADHDFNYVMKRLCAL